MCGLEALNIAATWTYPVIISRTPIYAYSIILVLDSAIYSIIAIIMIERSQHTKTPIISSVGSVGSVEYGDRYSGNNNVSNSSVNGKNNSNNNIANSDHIGNGNCKQTFFQKLKSFLQMPVSTYNLNMFQKTNSENKDVKHSNYCDSYNYTKIPEKEEDNLGRHFGSYQDIRSSRNKHNDDGYHINQCGINNSSYINGNDSANNNDNDHDCNHSYNDMNNNQNCQDNQNSNKNCKNNTIYKMGKNEGTEVKKEVEKEVKKEAEKSRGNSAVTRMKVSGLTKVHSLIFVYLNICTHFWICMHRFFDSFKSLKPFFFIYLFLALFHFFIYLRHSHPFYRIV